MNRAKNNHLRYYTSAFTLIELLVVIVIIGVLMAMVIPSMVGSMAAMRLTQAGDLVVSTFSLAQQRSTTMGRPIEVRLYKNTAQDDPGSEAGYRSILVFEYYQLGEYDPRRDLETGMASMVLTAPVAISRQGVLRLPANAVISENSSMSSFLTDLPTLTNTSGLVQTLVRAGGGYSEFKGIQGGNEYKSIVFYPENTSLNENQLWFLTVVDDSQRTSPIGEVTNFYTVSLDPVTGATSSYRP